MADVGTVTGIVGMLTGIAGSAMGYLGYRQSTANKALDLRLQLRRDVNALKATFDPLPQTIEAGVQSRLRVLAATGLGLSGNQVIFQQAAEADKASVAKLAPQVAALDRDLLALSRRELELHLGEVHRLTLEASRLAGKYKAAMDEDDRSRAQIKADRTAITAAHIQAPRPTR